VQHGAWLRRDPGRTPDPDELGVDVGAARDLVDRCLAHAGPEGRWLDPDDAVRLCRAFGIRAAETRRAASADEAAAVATELGFPVALKAGSGTIVHKTDVGGVHLGLGDGDAVRAAFGEMEAALGSGMGGAVVQTMVPPGVETIVGVTHDRLFGPLVLFGMGGIAAELVADRTVQIVPVTDRDAHDMVRALRSSPLLFGYRGTPEADVAVLEDLLVRVGALADHVPEVVEMDANPVIVSDSGAIAVDVKLRLARPPDGPPPGMRRLRV